MIRYYIMEHGREALRDAFAITGAAYLTVTGLALIWEAFQ